MQYGEIESSDFENSDSDKSDSDSSSSNSDSDKDNIIADNNDDNNDDNLWKTQNNDPKSEQGSHDPWNWNFNQEKQDESGIVKDNKKTRMIKQFESWNIQHRNQVMTSQNRNNKFFGQGEKR